MLTNEQLANQFNARSINKKFTKAEIELAKSSGLAFAYAFDDSDYLEHVILKGAIDHDEVVDFDAKYYLIENSYGQYWMANDEEYGKMAGQETPEGLPFIERTQGFIGDGFVYKLTSSIPHVSFNMMERGQLYCIGIVFSINDLPQ